MLVAYVSGHGFGHLTRCCEVLRAVRARSPALAIAVVGAVPEALVRAALPGRVELRPVPCDVGLVQRDALHVDEPATARACAEFDAAWRDRVAAEVAFLRSAGARLVLGDIPALAFAAAASAGVPGVALGNFSWDWIYRHLAAREPSLTASADRAATAYGRAALLLELPFAGDLAVFPRRERVGFVARGPRVDGATARRLLGLDSRPAVLLSFGGVGLPALGTAVVERHRGYQWLMPADLRPERLQAIGLDYPDVVGAVDVVVTKPGYGIVADAIGAGTRIVYTDRGDFPEYPIIVREMPRYLACAHVSNQQLMRGEIVDAIDDVLGRPMPPQPDVAGADRAAERLLAMS